MTPMESMPRSGRSLRARTAALVLALLAAGCQSLYFAPASAPPQPVSYALANWPDREYWWGLVFNGQKIGFSHLALSPLQAEPGLFEMRSDSAFLLRFLGYEKRVDLKAYDVVRDDLSIARFRYEYGIDGNSVTLAGERRGDVLHVRIEHAGEVDTQEFTLVGPVYPQSATALYPALHGLVSGRRFRYSVYSGELRKVAEVAQSVGPYQRSKVFEGEAFRVETAMEGYRVDTWIDARARPLLEIAMNGVLISGLESEQRAKSYLAVASLSKDEALLEYSIVRVAPPIAEPRRVRRMVVAVGGTDRAVPSDGIQRCTREQTQTRCDIAPGAATTAPAADEHDSRYLASTFTVPSRNARITALAKEIAGGAIDPRERIRLVVAWIDGNVRKSPVDAISALDVLDRREAECQGHAYLYAALARALRIPTRVVNGVVYSADFDGFLYHTWAESLVAGRWLAVDPTFGAIPADATHIKLVEGETLAEATPLTDWIGRLQLRVIEVER